MSRRIINRDTDSLKVEKQKAANAKAEASTAKDEVKAAETELASLLTRITEAETKLQTTEEKYDDERNTLASLYAEIATKRAEARSVDGELADVLSKVAEAKAELQSLVSESAQTTERLSKDHQDAMAAYAATQDAAQKAVDEAKRTLAVVESDIVAANQRLATLRKEEESLVNIKPELEKAQAELESLNHQVLVKKVELKNAEEAILVAVGKTNDEKNAYEQALALRTAEEARVQTLLTQLIDKEDEVEKKMRSLRVIQEGVDQATKRLERKKEELELQQHLATSSTAVTNT